MEFAFSLIKVIFSSKHIEVNCENVKVLLSVFFSERQLLRLAEFQLLLLWSSSVSSFH